MIKNLDKKLNEAGKIKIGQKGQEAKTSNDKVMRLPEKLDHFVITTTEKDQDGDFIKDIDLMDAIKNAEGCILNGDANITGIPIRLLYDSTELNFPTRMACYDRGILICTGDGEKAQKRLDDFKINHPCPCKKSEQAYTGNDKCKPNGKLTVVLDEAGLFGQVHVFRTTSWNSVSGILGGLELIKAATGGKIAGLPLVLTLTTKNTAVPGSGANTKIFVVSVCYRGNMMDLQSKCIELATQNAHFMIGMRNLEAEAISMGVTEVVPADEDQDFQEEFYPNSVMDAEFSTVQEERSSDDNQEEFVQQDKSEESVNGFPIVHPFLQETPEVVNSRDLLTPAQQEEAAKSRELAKEEVAKLGLLHRLRSELEPEPARKLVNRLDKKYILLYLRGVCDDIEGEIPNESEGKPVIVEFANKFIGSERWLATTHEYLKKDRDSWREKTSKQVDRNKQESTVIKGESSDTATTTYDPFLLELAALNQNQPEMVAKLRKRFPDTVINGTLPPEDLIRLGTRLLCGVAESGPESGIVETPQNKDLEKQVVTPEKNTPDQDEESPNPLTAWDDVGPVTEPQMAQIAQLKGVLKIKDFSDWSALVGRYKDRNGESLPLAANMTSKQADNFICELNLKADGIPF